MSQRNQQIVSGFVKCWSVKESCTEKDFGEEGKLEMETKWYARAADKLVLDLTTCCLKMTKNAFFEKYAHE